MKLNNFQPNKQPTGFTHSEPSENPVAPPEEPIAPEVVEQPEPSPEQPAPASIPIDLQDTNRRNKHVRLARNENNRESERATVRLPAKHVQMLHDVRMHKTTTEGDLDYTTTDALLEGLELLYRECFK